MNPWLTTAKLVPVLGLIPLGAAVQATFMQRDPARLLPLRADGETIFLLGPLEVPPPPPRSGGGAAAPPPPATSGPS